MIHRADVWHMTTYMFVSDPGLELLLLYKPLLGGLLPYQRQNSSCDNLRGEVCVGVPPPIGDQQREVNNQPFDVICLRNNPS